MMALARLLHFELIVVLCIACLLCAPSAQAKPFSNHQEGPGIMIADVGCYGEHEIRPEYMAIFKEQLFEQLQASESKGKMHIAGSDAWLTETGNTTEANTLRQLHFEAIVHGPLFSREVSNATVIRYAESVFGEDYFWDEDKLTAKRATAGHPYKLRMEKLDLIRKIAAQNNADYLLFCNLLDADIELKHSIFNAKSTLEERPKKIKVESFFYLVDAKSGQVYEGRTFSDKTGQILNLLGQYGKAMTAQNLLQVMFEVQSERIAREVCGHAKDALEKCD